jgi:hypothetical protein
MAKIRFRKSDRELLIYPALAFGCPVDPFPTERRVAVEEVTRQHFTSAAGRTLGRGIGNNILQLQKHFFHPDWPQ